MVDGNTCSNCEQISHEQPCIRVKVVKRFKYRFTSVCLEGEFSPVHRDSNHYDFHEFKALKGTFIEKVEDEQQH